MSAHVVIVGGGITGLAALEALTRESAPSRDLRVTLLESRDRVGGHIRTVRDEGVIMETGPDVLLTAKPAALDLARRVGIGHRIQPTNRTAKGSYILSRGELRRIPEGLTGLVPSRFGPFVMTPLVSPLGKARVALEYFIPPRRGDEDESIAQFAVRRLGREMYENLVEPLLSGISAGDGTRLSIDAMFPQLRAFERDHGGLTRGMLAARRAARARSKGAAPEARSAFASFPTGLEELVEAIVQTAQDRDPCRQSIDIRVGARVAGIIRSASLDGHGAYRIALADGEVLTADAVIIATPAYVASSLVGEIDPTLSAMLDAIEYSSTVTMSLVYLMSAVRRPLGATGYVVPRVARRPVLACTWASAKFVGRAPAYQALFRLFIGGAGRPDASALDDRQLGQLAANEMREVMGINAQPLLSRVDRFDRAMPQYTVGHRSRMQQIAARVAEIPALELAGAVYQGVGIPDCIRSGSEAADRVLAQLSQNARPLTETYS